jgi:hypothetical protein
MRGTEVLRLKGLANLNIRFPFMAIGQRLTHWAASSMDLTCRAGKLAITSLVSPNGSSITPAFASSALNPRFS